MTKSFKYREHTFLPPELIPENPNYFVWFTGTLGQAEWLITHSSELRGKTLPRECPKSPTDNACINKWSDLPQGIKSLMALEQPDLMIADSNGVPIMSIEITEQQDFGSNGQQRMARFWSAAANKIPSAYLLPIESYQIEEENSASTISIFKDKKSRHRNQSLLAKQIPDSHLETLLKHGIESLDDLSKFVLITDQLRFDVHEKQLFRYAYKHANPHDENGHLQLIDPSEYIHEIDGVYYKAYIRRPVVPGSMLLSWFERANKIVTSCVFKLQSEYELIFQTNGLRHTIIDPSYPHLSFRNLPPYPGLSKPVVKKTQKDEISLFFELVDAVSSKSQTPIMHREVFTTSGNYFDPEIKNLWQKSSGALDDIKASGKSGDYRISNSDFASLLENKRCATLARDMIDGSFYPFLNVYKIECKVPRSLADPYSGGLAVRDLLFTRNEKIDENTELLEFKRESGLVAWITLRNTGATKNTFIYKSIHSNYKKLIPKGLSIQPQEQLIEIFNTCRAEQVTKDIRNFVLFCDFIFVERILSTGLKHEVIYGLPMLIKLGKLTKNNKFLESLKCV